MYVLGNLANDLKTSLWYESIFSA